MFQSGSSPIRLSQLDVTPIVQASQMAEAANVNLSNAVNQSILDFTKKQEQKKQEKIGISSIQNMLGIDNPNLAKSIYKDEIVRDAYIMQQQALANKELSAKEIEAQQLMRDTDLPNVVIQDIVYDRTEPILDNRGNATGKVRSMTSGLLIDLRNPTNPFVIEPGPSPTPVDEKVDGTADVIDTGLELTFPEYIDPNMQNQGLYGQAKTLEDRKDFYTGIVSSVKEGIENTLSAQNIDSPIKQDPDVRAFKTALNSNLNIVANALRTNPRYYASEQKDLVDELESVASGFNVGAFTSPKVLEDKLKSLDSRLKREKRRLSNLLQSTQIDRKTASNVKLMLDQVDQAIALIGIDRYRGKAVDTMDVNEKRNFFNNIPID